MEKQHHSHEECDCGHNHTLSHEECDCGHNHAHNFPLLVADTRRNATLKGMVGALVDCGFLPFGEMMQAYQQLRLDVTPEMSVDIVHGCRGIRVEIAQGRMETKQQLFSRLASVDSTFQPVAELLHTVYLLAEDVCASEQMTEDPDLGSFLRTDVFGLLFLACTMMTYSKSEGLTVPTIEMGNTRFETDGKTVDAPVSMVAGLLRGLQVSSTQGLRGVDVPVAALIAACVVGQTEELSGELDLCGYGLDGDTVTRVYLMRDHD